MPLCLLLGDVNLDHLVKVVSAGFLHCEVTIFHFVVIKYLEGTTLRLCTYPVSLQILPTNFNFH